MSITHCVNPSDIINFLNISCHTWLLCFRQYKAPLSRNTFPPTVVYPILRHILPTLERYKVRLVAQGFLQQEGIDYNEVFAPVIDSTSITLLLSIANQYDWELEQMDVITAFLHGRLEEEVYMKIPPRMYIDGGAEGKVLRLKGALYGLKQSSHVWQEMFKKFTISEGFTQCVMDTCIYMRGEGDSRIILGIHVDDQVITGPNAMVVKTFKEDMGKKFKVKDLGRCYGSSF